MARPSFKRWAKRIAGALLAVVLLGMAYWGWWQHRSPAPETQIYRGVWYECFELPETIEGEGLVHVVRVDLTAPGIELFVTPTDVDAVREGGHYYLQYTGSVVAKHELAAAVNACMFYADSWHWPLPGDLATGTETTVADGEVSVVWEHSYLLWFDQALTPKLETRKPPPPPALEAAKWAISGQGVLVDQGRIRTGASTFADARTAIGIDPQLRMLWMVAFEHCSPARAGQVMVDLGARDVILVDGGTSTSMALGSEAEGVRSGAVITGYIPVATHFGVKAQPLE